jgi:hypothetical protein
MNTLLPVIDDIMIFPVNQHRLDAVNFFKLVNKQHDKPSMITINNPSPKNNGLML